MFAAKVHEMIEVALLIFLLWSIWRFFKSIHRSFLARMFQTYLSKAVLNYQYNSWAMRFGKEDLEAVKLAHDVMSQLNDGLDEAGPKIREHGLEHGAILYCRTVHVPVHIADPNLYKAIDILKQLFYKMHGTHFDPTDKKCPRNHCQISVRSKNGHMLPFQFTGMTLPGIMEKIHALGLDDPDDKDGTIINVEMSVLTPYTRKGYFYKHFCKN